MATTELLETDARSMAKAVSGFGVALLIALVTACLLAQVLALDLIMLAAFPLAVRIRDRSVEAARGAIIYTICYCIGLAGAALALLNSSVFHWWPAQTFRDLNNFIAPPAAAAFLILVAWGVHIIWRLVNAVRRRIPVGHCRRCGYDVRDSDERCPECGHAIDDDILAARKAHAAFAAWSRPTDGDLTSTRSRATP